MLPNEIEEVLSDPITKVRMKSPVIYTGNPEIKGLTIGISYEKDNLIKIAKAQNVSITDNKVFYENRALKNIIDALDVSSDWESAINDNLIDCVSFDTANYCLISPRGDLYSEETAANLVVKYNRKDPFTNVTLNEKDIIRSINLVKLSEIARKHKDVKDDAKIPLVEQKLQWVVSRVIPANQTSNSAIKLVKDEENDRYHLCVLNNLNSNQEPTQIYLDKLQIDSVMSGNMTVVYYQLLKKSMSADVQKFFSLKDFTKDENSISELLDNKPAGTPIIHVGTESDHQIVISCKEYDGRVIHKNYESNDVAMVESELRRIQLLPLEKLFIHIKSQLMQPQSYQFEDFVTDLNAINRADENILKDKTKGSYVIYIDETNSENVILQHKNYTNTVVKEIYSIRNQGSVNDLLSMITELNLLRKLITVLGPEIEPFINSNDLKLSENEAEKKLSDKSMSNNTFLIRAIPDQDQIAIYFKSANGVIDKKLFDIRQVEEIKAEVSRIKELPIKELYGQLKQCLSVANFETFKANLDDNAKNYSNALEGKLPGSFILYSSKNDPTRIKLKYLNQDNQVCEFRYSMHDQVQVNKLIQKIDELNSLHVNQIKINETFLRVKKQFSTMPPSLDINQYQYNNDGASQVLIKNLQGKVNFIIHDSNTNGLVTLSYINKKNVIKHLDFKWRTQNNKEVLCRNDSRATPIEDVVKSLMTLQKQKKSALAKAFESVILKIKRPHKNSPINQDTSKKKIRQ
jgi:hypothetical protein